VSIEGLSAASGAPFTEFAPVRPQNAPGVDFATTLERELGALNQKVETAGQSLTDLASGESGNLHRVMLDLEQAKLSFQLAVQVRNKLLESYQELMRMQI
jgi:flagellar hook-basal body complex protein FliE